MYFIVYCMHGCQCNMSCASELIISSEHDDFHPAFWYELIFQPPWCSDGVCQCCWWWLTLLLGYQRELTYQRDDGSFSAFGNDDQAGSIW